MIDINFNKQVSINKMLNILYGYNQIYPLNKYEINIFFIAVCSRVLVIVLNCAQQITVHPENSYV